MPSNAFTNIFDNAVSIVRHRCRTLKGTDVALDDIRQRAYAADNHNPLLNRNLIVEPRVDAQRLEIPKATAETVAEELHRLNVLHVWVRARCPSVDPSDPNILVETDNSDRFQEAISLPCPHCGQYHEDLTWHDIDRFYAINFQDDPDNFDFKSLLRPTVDIEHPETVGRRSLVGRFLQWAADRQQQRQQQQSAVVQATALLETNGPLQSVPPAHSLCIALWKSGLAYAVITALATVVTYVTLGAMMAVIVASIMVSIFAIVAYISLRLVLATPVVQRLCIASGYGAAALLFLNSQIDLDIGVSQNDPWHFGIKTHDTSPGSIWGGVAVIIGTSLCACLHQWITTPRS